MGSKQIHTFCKISILAFALLCSAVDIRGQHANVSFEHFTNEDGLSAPVTHITQDKYGFLWLGTTDGLNRFDGINFIVYRNIPGDSTSLTNNIINSLHVDQNGRVWVATNGGLCYYDYADDRFHAIHFDVTLEKLDRHRVHAVCSDQNNTIWFATRTMLHQMTGTQVSKSILLPASEILLIKFLHIDHQNRKWIGSNDGLHLYLDKEEKFLNATVQSPFSVENKLSVTVHPMINYRADTLLIGSWYADMQKVFLSGDSIVTLPYADNFDSDPRRHIVSGIAPSMNSLWWIGTYGAGLSLFDGDRNQYTDHFLHNPADEKSLSDDYINDIYRDVAGIIWIGTSKGLDKFDPLTQQFRSVSIPVPPHQFAIYRLANTIVEDILQPGWLWLCVSGAGLFHYNIATQEFNLFQFDATDSSQLPGNNIYSFYYDHLGRSWVGTRSGLLMFDTRQKRFLKSPLTDKNNVVGAHTILQDKESNFWIATNSNGIYLYKEKENELISYSHDDNDPNSIPDNKIFCMLQDTEGKIWIGTQNSGLCRLDPKTNQFLFFRHEKSNPNSIPDNGVYDLHEDEHHQLWLGTENGFASMDLHSYQIRNYSTIDGLCNNTVLSITPDPQNHLWLGTNNGFSNFDPVSKQFRNYYTNDGLPFNRVAGDVLISSDSTLYFGTTGMLSFCRPESMKMNKHVPPVIITDFSILGKKVPVMRNAEMLQPIHLTHKQNMITFNFAALNYTNSFLNQYAYKLDGFDEDWINCGSRQSATYTNLNGGSYVFHVKAANNDGFWNDQGTSVLLYVHPPFWKTWWFYLLCTVAVAGALFAFYRFRINQIMRLQHIRTRIARDLHDDIGSTLSSINMISSMADKTITQKKSSELFSTISVASSQAMELMSDIVWSINPKNDRMEMIITRMRQYASEILEAADISFSIIVDESSKDVLMPLEMRKDFYLIFKEAVNNLAKYSQAEKAVIHLGTNHHSLHLNISDNGRGFDPAGLANGNGLRNMKARTNQLKGTIMIKSTPGGGTVIDLLVPLSP